MKNLDRMLADHQLYTQDEMARYKGMIGEQEQILKMKLETLKAHAKELGGMRRDFGDDKRASAVVRTARNTAVCFFVRETLQFVFSHRDKAKVQLFAAHRQQLALKALCDFYGTFNEHSNKFSLILVRECSEVL